MKIKIVYILIIIYVCIDMNNVCYSDQRIIAKRVNRSPIIDGNGDDNVWKAHHAIKTYDKVANINISIKAIFTKTGIFFLVVFPDPDESRKHKRLVWSNEKNRYIMGPDREDCFIFKWSMMSKNVDLSIYSDTSYYSDIWFWKAHRTDPEGFADDKIQHLGVAKVSNSKKIKSKSGKTMFLLRLGDKGTSAYQNIFYIENKGDRVPYFQNRLPKGSRADIRAKGSWRNGKWTVEFGRKLKTGHKDDIQFRPGRTYQFGISRYEIAGRKPDPNINQPLYGSGDVSEKLILEFSR